VAALGTVVACSVLATAAGAASDCDPRGGEEVQRSPSGKIAIVRNSNYEGHDLYMACWRPTGKLQPMSSDWLFAGRAAPTAIGGFNFRGPWVTWAQTSVDGTETDSMRSLNVRTGRLGPRVAADPDARAAEDHGPIQHTDGALSRMVAISRSGMYAWVVRGARTPEGKAVDALYVPRDGSALRVDVGEVGSIQRLFFRGKYLVWIRDGKVRSVKPDPTSAETPAGNDAPDTCHPTLPNGSWPPGEQPSPGWHGNGKLWTNVLYNHGVLRFGMSFASPDTPAPMDEPGVHADGSATTKMLWIGSPSAGRRLKIGGRRLDGPASRLHSRSRSVAKAGRPRLWASDVTFPTSGCWRVTATARGANLTFRLKVVIPQPAG
jgi:hypothetical protein